MNRALSVTLLILLLVNLSSGSHVLYGTVSFVRNVTDPLVVSVTLNAAFKKSWFATLPYPSLEPGDQIFDNIFDYGDGEDYSMNYEPLTITQVNDEDDFLVLTKTSQHVYPSAGNYVIRYGNPMCCRLITGLNNNIRHNMNWATGLSITQNEINRISPVNNPPQSGMLPIVNIPFGIANYQFQLSASDPENDNIVFSMATPIEMGQTDSTQPPGLSVSSSGLVTITNPLAPGYWSTVQKVVDSTGNYIFLDYMIYVYLPNSYCNGVCTGEYSNTSCISNVDCASCGGVSCVQSSPRLIVTDISASTVPRTNKPTPVSGAVITRNIGQSFEINFVADDANLVNPVPVSIYPGTSPETSLFLPQTACNSGSNCVCVGCSGNSQIRTFTWTPVEGDEGTHSACVGVKSQGNYLTQSQHCVTLKVNAAPPVTSQAVTSRALTTQSLTTKSLTTQPAVTTRALTSSRVTTGLASRVTTGFSVAAKCTTYSYSGQGYFCSADRKGYYQCLEGAFLPQSSYKVCPSGTSCKCAEGVDCASSGLCTSGL